MKISKKDALLWFRFFSELPDDESLGCRQQEIALAVFSQIETAVDAKHRRLLDEIRGLKAVVPGESTGVPYDRSQPPCTLYIGPDEKFPRGCRSCLLGTGLSAVRKTNRCNAACPFCYDYGILDRIPPIGEGLWRSAAADTAKRICRCCSGCKKSRPESPTYIWSPLWKSKNTTV